MQKHVLVVDDETTILLAFKKLLQTPGVYVDTAESMEDVKILLTDTMTPLLPTSVFPEFPVKKDWK